MRNVPKKVMDRFLKTVPKFQKVLGIAKDRDVNESDTVSILQDIFSEVFGYEKYLEVTTEFAIRSTYCDLALKIDDKVQFLIEAKAIGIDLKENHIRQAIDYGANHGVQWVILTNGIHWRIYRIRFEKPISHDLVSCFDFSNINIKEEKEQDILFLISKEGVVKNARDSYFEKHQSVNRFVIANLILSEPVITIIRRELKKIADGIKVEPQEVESIIRTEVLKRELVTGEEASSAKLKVNRLYKKCAGRKKRPRKDEVEEASSSSISFSDSLLQGVTEKET